MAEVLNQVQLNLRRVANIGEYDFYTFEGLMPKHNERLHITSTVFDEPTLLKMLDHSDETISIHGYSGEDPIVYVGGRIKISEIYHKIIKK